MCGNLAVWDNETDIKSYKNMFDTYGDYTACVLSLLPFQTSFGREKALVTLGANAVNFHYVAIHGTSMFNVSFAIVLFWWLQNQNKGDSIYIYIYIQ